MDCDCHWRDGKICIEIVPIFSNLSYEEKMEVAGITSQRTSVFMGWKKDWLIP